MGAARPVTRSRYSCQSKPGFSAVRAIPSPFYGPESLSRDPVERLGCERCVRAHRADIRHLRANADGVKGALGRRSVSWTRYAVYVIRPKGGEALPRGPCRAANAAGDRSSKVLCGRSPLYFSLQLRDLRSGIDQVASPLAFKHSERCRQCDGPGGFLFGYAKMTVLSL